MKTKIKTLLAHPLKITIPKLLAGALAMAGLAATASAATLTWTNTAGGNWSTAANWTPNGVPGASDTALITTPGTYTVTVNVAESVNTLTLGAASGTQTLNLSSGTFTMGSASTVNAQGILSLSGTLAGAGSLVVNGPLDINGGTITLAGGVIANDTLTVTGEPAIGSSTVAGVSLVNNGTATFNSANTILLYDGASLVNSAAATFTWTPTGNNNSLAVNESGSANFIANLGIFNADILSGDTGTIGVTFNNSGAGIVNVTTGTLSLNGGGTDSYSGGGTDFAVASGATLAVGGSTYTFDAGTTIGGPGNFTVSSGTANLNGAVTVSGMVSITGGVADCGAGTPFSWTTLNLSGGTLSGTTPVSVSGVMTFSGIITDTGGVAANGTLTITGQPAIGSSTVAGVSLVNNGTATFNSANTILLYDGASLVNSAAATFTWTPTGNNNSLAVNESGSANFIANLGIFNADILSGDTGTIGVTFNNSGAGIVNVTTGTLSLNGGGTDSYSGGGTDFAVASGATLAVGGSTYTFDAGTTIGGPGNFTVSSGTANLNGTLSPGGNYTVSGGTANFAGSYDITTPLSITGGSAIFTGGGNTVAPNTLTLTGTLGGSVPVSVSGVMTFSGIITDTGGVAANGTLTITGQPAIGSSTVAGVSLVNNGTATFNSANTILLYDGASLVNSAAATFTWTPTGNNNSLAVNESGSANFIANLGIFNADILSGDTGTIGVTFNNSGTMNISNGTLDMTGAHSLTGGTLDFGINSLSSFGKITLSGASALAGTLASTFNGGYLPSVGNSYQVISYGSASGGFTYTNLSPLAVWQVTTNSTSLTITVLKLVPQITWTNPADIVYGTALNGTQLNATATWNGSAVPGMFSYTPPAGTVLDSGSNQTLAVTFTPMDTSTYTNVTTTVAINVQKAPLTVTANNNSKSYGQSMTFAGTEFATSGLVNGDTVASATLSSDGTGPTASVAGSPYTIAIASAVGSPDPSLTNYVITYMNGTLTVNPAALTITANNHLKIYGQTVTFAGTEFTPVGLQNSETIGAVALISAGASPAASVSGSPYSIAPSAATGGTFNPANYKIAYVNGSLTVNPAALTITANNTSKTYGQAMTFARTEFTPVGLQNAETVGTVMLTSSGSISNAPVSGSPYSIVPSAATGGTFNSANYSIAYANGALTVNPAALTVTASAQSKTYGQTLTFGSGSTLFSNSSLQNNETIGTVTLAVSGTGGAATASVAGSPYTITPSAATGGTFTPGNYAITYANGNLMVNPALLTVTANNANKIFGQTITFVGTEFTATGLQNSESVGSVTLASAGSLATAAVGTYGIVPSAPTGGTFSQGNYTDAFVNGTLTVSEQPLLTISLNETNNIVMFPTVTGETYQLLSTTNLLLGNWTPVGSAINGTGGSASVTNAIGPAAAYYQLQIQN